MLATCIWVMKRSLGKRWQVFFFFRISQLLADGFLSQPLTHRQKLIQREVRLEDIFLCQSSGEGSYGDGVPVFFKWRVEKTQFASFRDPALTPKKKSKILRNGEGITKFQTPEKVGHESYGGPKESRGKTTTNEEPGGLVGLVDRHKRLGSTPRKHPGFRMQSWQNKGFFVGNSY